MRSKADPLTLKNGTPACRRHAILSLRAKAREGFMPSGCCEGGRARGRAEGRAEGLRAGRRAAEGGGAGGDDGGANGRLGRDAAASGAEGSGAEGDGGGEEGSGHRVALRFAL